MVSTKRFVLALFAMVGLGLGAACDATSPEDQAPEEVASSESELIVGPNGLIHPICTETFAGDQWRGLGSAIYTDYASGRECVLGVINGVGDLEFDPLDYYKPTAVRLQGVTSGYNALGGCAPPAGTPLGAVTGTARFVWAAEGFYDESTGACQVFLENLDSGAWVSEMRFVARDEYLAVFETAPDLLPNLATRSATSEMWFFKFKNQPAGTEREQFALGFPGTHYAPGGGFMMEDADCRVTGYSPAGAFLLHTCDTIPGRGGVSHETSAGMAVVNRFDFDYPNNPDGTGPFQTAGFHLGRDSNSGQNFAVAIAHEEAFLRQFQHTENPNDPPVPGPLTPHPVASQSGPACVTSPRAPRF